MINKRFKAGTLILFSFMFSGCLSESVSNLAEEGSTVAVTPPTTTPPTTTPPTTTPPTTTPPTTTPPTNILTGIPDVTFDYLQEPGAVTTSGPWPSTVGAGEVYAFTGETVPDDARIDCQGTEQNPAMIVGGTLSGTNDVVFISGSWCFFIDVKFEAMQPRASGDHIVFRNVESTGSNAKNGMDLNGSNIVVIDSEIHHNQRPDHDAHGIQVGRGARDIWILGNHIHHNSGNGLQACHQCDANPPSGIYIGNNLFHSDREVGIGLKWADNVIIEGNVFHSYESAPQGVEWCFDDGSLCSSWSSGSDGSAIVIGADNDHTGLTRVQVIGNETYDTNNAVRIESSGDVIIVDNNFHDFEGSCLSLEKDGMNTLFQGNTCRNGDRGIFQFWRVNFSIAVDGNVFENIASPAIEYETRDVCDDSTLTGNQFVNSGAIICGNTVATTTADVNALPGALGNVVE